MSKPEDRQKAKTNFDLDLEVAKIARKNMADYNKWTQCRLRNEEGAMCWMGHLMNAYDTDIFDGSGSDGASIAQRIALKLGFEDHIWLECFNDCQTRTPHGHQNVLREFDKRLKLWETGPSRWERLKNWLNTPF